jgi:hypothetical protein
VDEEIEAWHRGFRLARRLGIVVDREAYAKLASRQVAKYLKWAVRAGGY